MATDGKERRVGRKKPRRMYRTTSQENKKRKDNTTRNHAHTRRRPHSTDSRLELTGESKENWRQRRNSTRNEFASRQNCAVKKLSAIRGRTTVVQRPLPEMDLGHLIWLTKWNNFLLCEQIPRQRVKTRKGEDEGKGLSHTRVDRCKCVFASAKKRS